MLKNEREKFFLSVIVVLIIAGFLTWQGVININAEIGDSISELKDKKISRDVYGLKEASFDEELEAYNFSKNKIEEINEHFVYASDNDDTEFTSFFGQLDEIAIKSTQKEKSLAIDLYQGESNSAAKNKQKSSDPKSASSVGGGEESRLLKLTLKSNFEGLLRFISSLEAMPYYVYIESVNIKVNNSDGAKKTLNNESSVINSPDLQSILIIKVFRKINVL